MSDPAEPTKQHTIEMLADWIVKNKNEDTFCNDTKEQIALGIRQDIKDGNILYVFDDNEMDFIGVVSFLLDKSNKILFVRNLLITKHTSLAIFIKYFRMQFSDYCICANRKNKYMEYNTHRMLNLISVMKGKE